MKRTVVQNRAIHALCGKLHIDPEVKADLAFQFSGGRTEHTSELTYSECVNLITELQKIGKDRANRKKVLDRMRWKLRYCFADYGMKTDKGKPDTHAIDQYCIKWWGRCIDEMSKEEIGKYIALVGKWKKPENEDNKHKTD
jgi:hypothetical protein